MKSRYRLINFFILLFAGLAAFAGTPQEALDKLLASPSLTPSKTTVLIYDLQSGRTVVAHNEFVPMVPASVMKCVTTAAFTTKYRYADRLETKVYTTGKIKDGVLYGDIVVVGSGDPSLCNNREPGERDLVDEIVESLLKKGITSIEGGIVVDNSFIGGPAVPDYWVDGDIRQAYGTGYHAFNYQGNASNGSAVANPDKVFIQKLTSALGNKEITLTGASSGDNSRKLLLSHPSPMLSNLLRTCLFRSDNLYAEAFLRLFGKKSGSDGSTVESAKAEVDFWTRKGMPLAYVNIVDGSGLSRHNRLTADFLGEVLGEMSDDPMYVSCLPLTGEEGTVRKFLDDTPLDAYMALKTGSMKGIQSYAGYKLDEDFEPTHVVVVMSNELKDRDKFRAALTSFFLEIFTES